MTHTAIRRPPNAMARVQARSGSFLFVTEKWHWTRYLSKHFCYPCLYPSYDAAYSWYIVYSHCCKFLGFTASCNEMFSCVTLLNVSEGLGRELRGWGCLPTQRVSVWYSVYCKKAGKNIGRIIWTIAVIVKIAISVTSAHCLPVRPYGATWVTVENSVPFKCDKNNRSPIYFLSYIHQFFSFNEYPIICEIMWKNTVDQEMPQISIRRMQFTH